MKTLKEKIEYKDYIEYYFGVGLGITKIDDCIVIILPFLLILLSPEKVYK